MKRNFLAAALFLSTALFLSSGCGVQKEKALDWQTYKFDQFHFSLESPFPFSHDIGSKLDEQYESQKMMKQTPTDQQVNGKFFVVTIVGLETKKEIAVEADVAAEA